MQNVVESQSSMYGFPAHSLVYHVSALLFLFLMFEWEEGLGGAGNLTDGMADEYFLFFNTRSTCLLLQKLT